MKFGQWLGFISLVLSLYILWQIRQILLLIFAAVVIATALNSLARRLQKSGLSRTVAVPLTLGIVVLVAILFFGLIVPPFINQFQSLIELLPTAFNQVPGWIRRWRGALPDWFPVLPDLSNLTQQLQPLVSLLLRNSFAIFSNSLNVLLQLLLVTVLSIMLLVNPQAYQHAFLQLFPSFYRKRADDILTECEAALGNWLAGICVSSLCVSALSGVGLLILGVPLVLAHALLAGLLNFIPNLGPTLSVVFPIAIALIDTPWKAIAVLILYLTIQQLESYWITPTVMARQVSLLPALTLVAQIFFASFFGIPGLLLALPLTVVAKVWLQEVLIKDVLDRWGGSEPTHESEVVIVSEGDTKVILPEANPETEGTL